MLSKIQESRQTRAHVVQNDNSKRILKDWGSKVTFLNECVQKREKFLTMLSKFQSMQYSCVECITTAKHNTKLLENHSESGNSAP